MIRVIFTVDRIFSCRKIVSFNNCLTSQYYCFVFDEFINFASESTMYVLESQTQIDFAKERVFSLYLNYVSQNTECSVFCV